MTDTAPPASELQRTPLHALHLELGARMVGFAGYDMPVSYPAGILAEHRHCRSSAALFDVSHMGQLRLLGADADRALESLVPVDVVGLGVGQQRYGFFTNANGGILDDLMITRREGDLFVIVNAGCKAADIAHLTTHIGHRCTMQTLPERALLALQGPKAVAALLRLKPGVDGADLHDRRRVHARRRRVLRHPIGLHRRGRLRDLGARPRRPRRSPARCWRSTRSSPPGSAHATRCASRPGCASTATTSTPGRRRSRPA